MKLSIRKFLLINLLLVIILTTTITAIGNYYIHHTYFYEYLYIIFIALPVTGALIWIIISKGLQSVNRVAEEVANRIPTHLEPVTIKNIPEEIQPLVDELNNLFYRLKEGFEREKRFAADAAHELRTPLAALKAQAQVALNTHNMEEKDQALQKLLTNVDRSTHVVQQLLTINKYPPKETNPFDLDVVNLTKITRETLAMLAPTAVEKKIELEFEHDKDVLIIAGNATAISILIRNLVDNAIRYCNEEGHVNVRLYQDKKEIIFEIRDDGPGIPKALQSRVFERFFRVLGNKSQGSGLGLAIVQQIATLHHARILLTSPTNKNGLIVSIVFPTIDA